MTAREILDDVEYELLKLGVRNPDIGRMIMLLRGAENDFAHQTNCLFKERTIALSNGVYDYLLDYDLINHGVVTDGPFVDGEGILGGTSGATATIVTAGIDGTVFQDSITDISGIFSVGETITGDDGGAPFATAVVVSEVREKILKIHSMRYGLSAKEIPIHLVPKSTFDLHPSYYEDYYEDLYTFIALNTVRLGFNPANSTHLKFIYSYEPNTQITGLNTVMTIHDIYKRGLYLYVMYNMLDNTDLYDKAEHYRKLYMNETKANVVIPKEKVTI